MTLAAEKELEHIGETSVMEDHDYDLIHELSKRLKSMWRYDQYIANARGDNERVQLWKDLKAQDQENIDRLREAIKREISSGCF